MEWLKQYLIDHDLTQADFARLMGVKQPTVWGWLNGALPSAEKLKEIADKTGTSTDVLLGRNASHRPYAA